MLDLLPAVSGNCQGLSRRHFLRLGALSGVGLSLPGLLAARHNAAPAQLGLLPAGNLEDLAGFEGYRYATSQGPAAAQAWWHEQNRARAAAP